MTWIRIDDHRVNVEEIIRFSTVSPGAEPKYKSEIELSSGSVIYVKPSLEELDSLILGIQK